MDLVRVCVNRAPRFNQIKVPFHTIFQSTYTPQNYTNYWTGVVDEYPKMASKYVEMLSIYSPTWSNMEPLITLKIHCFLGWLSHAIGWPWVFRSRRPTLRFRRPWHGRRTPWSGAVRDSGGQRVRCGSGNDRWLRMVNHGQWIMVQSGWSRWI